MKWISRDEHCEPHCMNKTTACFSCEELDDCNCELIEEPKEICEGIDKETGLRDCWNFSCNKSHIKENT